MRDSSLLDDNLREPEKPRSADCYGRTSGGWDARRRWVEGVEPRRDSTPPSELRTRSASEWVNRAHRDWVWHPIQKTGHTRWRFVLVEMTQRCQSW